MFDGREKEEKLLANMQFRLSVWGRGQVVIPAKTRRRQKSRKEENKYQIQHALDATCGSYILKTILVWFSGLSYQGYLENKQTT